MVGSLLEPMMQANTQPEFDQALLQVVAMGKMMSGMVPGGPGPPGGPGFQGGPGGFAPPPGRPPRQGIPGGPNRVPVDSFPE
jgi:hypothetical protein